MVQDVVLTSAAMWTAAGAAAAVDAALLAMLAWRVRRPWPAPLAVRIGVVGAVSFALLFTWAFRTYWDTCYGFALPPVMKQLAPAIGGALGALGWVFWRLASRCGSGAVPLFLLLGGLESLPGHLNAIERMRLLERCPMLQPVSPLSAYVFGVFEFAFYWSVVLGVAWWWATRARARG